MLNDVQIKKLFTVRGKNYMDRVIIAQVETKNCKSFIRNKLMLRYSFELSVQIVRDEIMHKIMAEKPLLITNALRDLLTLRENIEKCNVDFFIFKSPCDIMPSYINLLNYMGLHSKKSKIYNRIKNFITICERYSNNKISEELFKKECRIQLNSLEKKLHYYTRSDPADMIVYIFRYDVKK